MKKTGILLLIAGLGITVFALLKPDIFRKTFLKIRYTGRMKNYKEFQADKNSVWGIDISHHQANIEWSKFKNSKPDFIFLKATEGINLRDTRYKEYKKMAQDQSIIVGAYHFFNYSSNGKDQAENFLEFADLNKGNLPPVLDVEFKNNMPPKQKVQRELMAFINHVEKNTGEKPIIYCDRDYYNKYLISELNGEYPLWICDYFRKPACSYTFWQKTDGFRHPAFKGLVDYNTFSGTREQLNELTMK